MGWSLEFLYDTRGYFTHALMPTRGSLMKSAYEVQKFVWDRAKKGDKLCRRALAIVSASELAGKSKTAGRKTRK